MPEENYPRVFERVKAMVVDTIVILAFILMMFLIFSLCEHVPDNARIIAFVFIFLLYDPSFTSLFGGTLGHTAIGIRLKRDSNESKNIIFHLAILRYLVKAFLGWISLLTILGNKKGKSHSRHARWFGCSLQIDDKQVVAYR